MPNRSDEELDREWKPSSTRPQSTMARSFSLALNDIFGIENSSLAELDATVSEKCASPVVRNPRETDVTARRKQRLSTQTSELEALEARLRATEERLRKATGGGIPPVPAKAASGKSSPRPRMGLGGNTFAASPTRSDFPTSPLAAEFKNSSRPNTGRKGEAHPYNPPVPGALPPTPGASEGEGESDSDYVLVERRERKSADIGQDGDIPDQK